MCPQIFTPLDTKILLESLLAKIEEQQNAINFLMKNITALEAEIAYYKNKKNSRISSISSSEDENLKTKKDSSIQS